MRPIHRILGAYTATIVILILMFAFTAFYAQPEPGDLFSMALSIALFALIPLAIIILVWKHHSH